MPIANSAIAENRLGDIRTAKELGYKTTTKFIWAACKECGKERWVELRQDQPRATYCRACSHKGERGCQWGKRREETTNWKGGRRKTFAGYIEILQEDHPRARASGYVFEHIVVWEKVNNKPLPGDWIIHHLNGIRDDNRPSNLIGLPRRKHSYALVLEATRKKLREKEAEVRLLEQTLESKQLIVKLGED